MSSAKISLDKKSIFRLYSYMSYRGWKMEYYTDPQFVEIEDHVYEIYEDGMPHQFEFDYLEANRVFLYMNQFEEFESFEGNNLYEHKLSDEIIAWMKQNDLVWGKDVAFSEPMLTRGGSHPGAIHFKNKEDAMAFKLVWQNIA